MKSMYQVLFLSCLAIFAGGCVSIGTHERKMKMCRALEEEKGALEARLAALESENQGLSSELEESSEELAQKEKAIEEIQGAYEDLLTDLKEDIAAGLVGVTAEGDGLQISMGNKVLFKSGRADLQPKGEEILKSVSSALQKVSDRYFRIDGHSDNRPIVGSLKNKYPTNWELSAARAASVARFLQSEGVDPENLILTSFADNRPVGDNKTPEGRQLNRRVEIHLVKKAVYDADTARKETSE